MVDKSLLEDCESKAVGKEAVVEVPVVQAEAAEKAESDREEELRAGCLARGCAANFSRSTSRSPASEQKLKYRSMILV